MKAPLAGVVLCLGFATPIWGEEPQTDAAANEPTIPVVVTAKVTAELLREGEPIPLQVTIHNELKDEIRYLTNGLSPVDWNGETRSLTLVDVYRDGERAHVLERPNVDVPLTIAGMSGKRIEPGKSLTIETDARKWTILGGWIPGKYRVNVRVENLSVDQGRCQLGVHSEPFEFEIAAAESADHTNVGVSTEELRQQYLNAKTPQESQEAKAAWLADLKKRYAGIDASVTGAQAGKHGARFGRLMIEWNPIQFSANDLKSIAGKPTRETSEVLDYTFDLGRGAYSWLFTIQGDTIRALEYIPGD
ncbi:MAG: hypothetical protein WD065_14285 [Planctomycetaceae bacterium]